MAAARGIHVTAAVEGEGEGAARDTSSADNSIAYQGAFDGKSQISLPSPMPTTRVALGARQYYWNVVMYHSAQLKRGTRSNSLRQTSHNRLRFAKH